MISKTSDIEDIVSDYPELIRPLKEYGIACIACGEPVWGTLKDIAESKKIENLDLIINEMNNIIKKGNQ